MFQQGSLRLVAIRGVPIRAHWTLLLILPYLAFVLSIQFRPMADLATVEHGRLSLPVLPPLIWGVVLALGLFVSITVHELAHTLAAIRFGGRVRSITLMLVGGVSQLVRAPRRPAHEAIMAVLGPATSLALGGLLYLAYANSATWPGDVQLALFYLAAMNVALGTFNLIPAFPMDGGRLLRAALAARLGRERATTLAALVGKICAIALGGFGIWTTNLLLMLIAVFVYTGAQGEVVRERVRSALEGLRVIDLLPLLRRPPPLIGSNVIVDGVLPRMGELDRLALVVVDPQGAPLTVIQPGDLAAVPARERGVVTVGELASRLPVRHVLVPGDASANDAIERASEAGVEFVVVADPRADRPGDLIGLVAAEDIARMVTLQTLAKRPPSATTSRPASPVS